MDSKKRMMFILEDDYYFITVKLLSILKALDCDKKAFEDYRKLGIILETIKNEENMCFFQRLMDRTEQNIFDNEKAIRFFCDSRLNVSVIKRVLFFLEKKNMVEMTRSLKNSNIDVVLKESEAYNSLIQMKVLDEDFDRCMIVRKLIPRIRSIKLETLQNKVWGYDEVSKWED